MNNIIVNQAYLFLIFILNGLFIGIIFDIFRILRRSFETPNLVTYIEDCIFWIISAMSFLYTLFVFNNGEIRGYMFIGLLLGIAIYMIFFSKAIVKISVKVITFFKNILYKIFKIIIYPVQIILKVINKAIDAFCKIFNNVENSLKKQVKAKNNRKVKNKEGF